MQSIARLQNSRQRGLFNSDCDVTYMHSDTHAQRSCTGGDYAFSGRDLPDLVKTPGYINEVKGFQVF